jgi:hypothetical protein
MSIMLDALGFYPGAPLERLEVVFEKLILPMMQCGPTNELAASYALWLESLTYERLIKAHETELHFAGVYAKMASPLEAIGKGWRTDGERLDVKPPAPAPVVAFWLPGAAILAHTQQLLTLLHALRDEEDKGKGAKIRPVVYILSPTQAEAKRVFEATGWPVHFLGDWERPQHPLPMMQMLARVDARVYADNAQALVFVSTPVFMTTASAMRLAPVNIWWSMKWYALPGAYDVDEFMTPRRGDTIELAERTWSCGHVCLPTLADPARAPSRRILRDRFKIADNQVAIAFFGREDKLTPQYGAAVATLLEANADAVFVYTGRTRRPEFENAFRHVAARCRYIGWVDVSATIWAIDVYADSFPMGSGHTAFAAMQAGVPVLTLMTPDNEKNSAAAHFMEILDNEDDPDWLEAVGLVSDEIDDLALAPYCFSNEEWHALLCELIQDPERRAEMGKAQQKFLHRFLMDAPLYAQKTSRIILNAIARKAGVAVETLVAPDKEPVPDAPEARQESSGGAVAADAGSGHDLEKPPEGS